jgi:hypothetical protein
MQNAGISPPRTRIEFSLPEMKIKQRVADFFVVVKRSGGKLYSRFV